MNRWLSRRMIGLLFLFFFAGAGCVDTAEPTGPVPQPPPDDGGDLTSVDLRADGHASPPAFDSLRLAP